MTSSIKVLYISGYSRSGTTLLGHIFGEAPRLVFVGELARVLVGGFPVGQVCGCGAPLPECPFWKPVAADAFARMGVKMPEEAFGVGADFTRFHKAAQVLLRPLRLGSMRERVGRVTKLLTDLYAAIDAVTDGSTIVDSSKNPVYAAVAGESPDVDLRVAHIVRDSRAVAYSWQRSKPTGPGSETYMPRISYARSAIEWVGMNALAEAHGRARSRFVLIRYEDFCERPEETVSKASRALHIPMRFEDARLPREASSAVHHSIAGNPSRFTRGPIAIKRDDEWRHRMPRSRRTLVGAMTSPLLLRFGYPLWV